MKNIEDYSNWDLIALLAAVSFIAWIYSFTCAGHCP
jgi:hypothetical protein